jgi:hypothetical protein
MQVVQDMDMGVFMVGLGLMQVVAGLVVKDLLALRALIGVTIVHLILGYLYIYIQSPRSLKCLTHCMIIISGYFWGFNKDMQEVIADAGLRFVTNLYLGYGAMAVGCLIASFVLVSGGGNANKKKQR